MESLTRWSGTVKERLLAKRRINEDGCWEWTGALHPNGYGSIFLGKNPNNSAVLGMPHRVSYQVLVGEIPDGFQIHHICGNRACFNPDHLRAVEGTSHPAYTKYSRSFKPNPSPKPRPSLEERFRTKYLVLEGDGCWEWQGRREGPGYGRFDCIDPISGRHTSLLAHRVAYLLCYGEFDHSLSVCHHCDNPSCVRPDHLFLGTHLDNMTDKKRKGRAPSTVGENHPLAKLSPGKAREMASLYFDHNIPTKQIADRFNVCESTAIMAISGRTWASACKRPLKMRTHVPTSPHLGKTHCVRGHEFTPENTYYYAKNNGRQCRACKAVRKEAKELNSSGD